MTENHPLIEIVTEPLAGKAAEPIAANTILEEAFVAGHPAEPETMARLEAAGKRRHAAIWHALPWIMALVALACVVLPLKEEYHFEPWADDSMEHERPPLPSGLTEQGRLLLGDPAMDELEQKRRLHLSDPENPAYFAEYANAWTRENDGLPPDFLETVARIAPDNAFFLYFAAAETGRKSIEKKKYTGAPKKPRIVDGVRLPPVAREVEYDITDRAVFDEALELISKAAALPEFETYTNEMIAARMRQLPSRTLMESGSSLSHVYGHTNGMMSLRTIVDVMGASSGELSRSGRKDKFIALAAQRDALLAGLARNPDINLIGELMHGVLAEGTAAQFSVAADRLGLVELAQKYRRQADALQEERDRRTIRSNKDNHSFANERSSSLTTITLFSVHRLVASPPPIQASELEPMRMAEHEIVGGLGALSVAIMMLIAALAVLLFRFLMPRRIRVPAKRMARVSDPTDWSWVLLLGVALPIMLFLVITRLTPLGGRDYGIMRFMFVFPGVHLIALCLGLLLGPATVMRWRLSRRFAPFGFTSRKAAFSITVTLLLLVPALGAYPVLVRLGLTPWTLGTLAAPLALVLCLVLVSTVRCLFGKPIIRLFKTTTAIAVLPAYAIAIVALCLLMPIYNSAEERWMARDTLIRVNPDAADLGAYEFKVAAQKRREINAMMGFE